MAKKVNYLNNKELLKEIHKSKMSFCWTMDQEYHRFDAIVRPDESITEDIVSEAKQNRANEIAAERHAVALEAWENTPGRKAKDKPRPIDFKFSGSELKDTDVILRVMTFDHIPLEPGRKNKPKTVADHHSRCNFPPFKHVALINNNWQEVARSHWEGGKDNGHFSVTQGRITEKLASMMMRLCFRYSMRSNWRGYTYVDEMRSHALVQLSQIGLQFDESKSQNPFAYYTAAITNSFTRVLNLEKRNQHIRDDLLQDSGQMPSFSRQLDHEAANKAAIEADAHEKAQAELKDRGYNTFDE